MAWECGYFEPGELVYMHESPDGSERCFTDREASELGSAQWSAFADETGRAVFENGASSGPRWAVGQTSGRRVYAL